MKFLEKEQSVGGADTGAAAEKVKKAFWGHSLAAVSSAGGCTWACTWRYLRYLRYLRYFPSVLFWERVPRLLPEVLPCRLQKTAMEGRAHCGVPAALDGYRLVEA